MAEETDAGQEEQHDSVAGRADPPPDEGKQESAPGERPDRRRFVTAAMGVSLAASYGTLGVMAGQFLYHDTPRPRVWLFVTAVDRLKVGESISFQIPGGEQVNVTRRSEAGAAADFLALSSTCPHLGCQVHWELQNNRFFCPCHNGVFTPEGKGIGGPPGEAGQSLAHYPLRIDSGLLFLQAPVSEIG
ncbi:MAG: ubiquinol-cytochrome c reductase iron-sulfur subunit [Gemmataceae bacterium]